MNAPVVIQPPVRQGRAAQRRFERGVIANRLAGPFNGSGGHLNTGADGGGTATQVYEQSAYFACDDCNELSLVYANLSGVSANGAGTQPFTIKAAIITGTMWGTAQVNPVFWANGARVSPQVQPGAVVESVPMHLPLAEGTRFMVRRWLTFAAPPTAWLSSEVNFYEGDEVREYGTALTDRIDSNDWAGGLYTRAGGAYVNAPPLAINGRARAGRARVLVVGDSISSTGSIDSGAVPLMGWARRALGNRYASISMGNSGYRLSDLMANRAVRAQRLQAMAAAGISHLLLGVVTNDLGAGQTAGGFMTQAEALRVECAASDIRLILTTSPPRTGPAGTGQFGSEPASVWTNRIALNQAIRAGNGVGHGFVDVAALTERPADPNLWDTTGGRGSSDGLHPNQATHEYIAAAVATQLPGLLR